MNTRTGVASRKAASSVSRRIGTLVQRCPGVKVEFDPHVACTVATLRRQQRPRQWSSAGIPRKKQAKSQPTRTTVVLCMAMGLLSETPCDIKRRIAGTLLAHDQSGRMSSESTGKRSAKIEPVTVGRPSEGW